MEDTRKQGSSHAKEREDKACCGSSSFNIRVTETSNLACS